MCFREDERRGRILLVVSHPEINVSLLSIVDLDDSRKAAPSSCPAVNLIFLAFHALAFGTMSLRERMLFNQLLPIVELGVSNDKKKS